MEQNSNTPVLQHSFSKGKKFGSSVNGVDIIALKGQGTRAWWLQPQETSPSTPFLRLRSALKGRSGGSVRLLPLFLGFTPQAVSLHCFAVKDSSTHFTEEPNKFTNSCSNDLLLSLLKTKGIDVKNY